jgi:hypothetical protein
MDSIAFVNKNFSNTKKNINIGNDIGYGDHCMKHGVPIQSWDKDKRQKIKDKR